MKKLGYTHKRYVPKSVLTERHKEKRREFAISHVSWSIEEWSHVIFTDEKHWSLDGNDGYISIWEKKNGKCLKVPATSKKGGLMIWGAISKTGGIRMICLEGKINASTYIDMLKHDFFEVVGDELPENFIWMHDNAPPHSAKATSAYLEVEGITTMKWPPLSPDLNPIENIWSIMKSKVYSVKKVFPNTSELWAAIVDAWHSIPEETYKSLYESLQSQMVKVIEEKGERIHY